MIEATRIEPPEVERPDLHVRLYMDERSPIDEHGFGTSWALPTMPEDAGGDWFRLPGTRRERLTKEREKLIADVVAAVQALDKTLNIEYRVAVVDAARRLATFDSLTTDAGVKT